MRVVGYVRDAPGHAEVEPAFAQSERIRKWVHESGHQLVGLCQDIRTPGRDLGRDGFRALLGVVETGEVEAVVLPDLTTLSADKVAQEIMLWDLQSRGVAVLSTTPADLDVLTNPPAEQIRIIVRDVLAKVAIHEDLLGGDVAPAAVVDLTEDTDVTDSDVIIELIPPDRTTPRSGRISPAT